MTYINRYNTHALIEMHPDFIFKMYDDDLDKIEWGRIDGEYVVFDDQSDTQIFDKDAVYARAQEIEAAKPTEYLREERDKRIAETDWWVLPDRTPTDEQLAYRQALRDITETYTSLDDVVWPTKPE